MKKIKVLLFVTLFAAMHAYADGVINAINVVGNQRVEESTIKEYFGLEVGQSLDESAKSEAVKRLYATTLFEDISIKYDQGKVTIAVQETPLVSKVVFVGNSKVKSATLSDNIFTVAGESLKKSRLASDVEKIKEIYKKSGRFTVAVSSQIEQQENNRVKVIFNIKEGPKTGVRKIVFVGNDHYTNSELRSLVLTKESRWFRFLESNDTYDPDRIEVDKHLLKQFYNSVGYADFKVLSVTADLDPTREGFTLTFSIDEGDKYSFGKIYSVNKIANIDNSEIDRFIKNETGNTFNLTRMERLCEKITSYLGGKGYPQVDVYPETIINNETKTVDVKIVVDEAKKIFINKINIEGNLKTEDYVIRRQLKIAEGDIYNRSKIERGEQNIRNLDYFEKLDLSIAPTKYDDKYDININVEEKSTTSLGLDLGYNSAGGPFGRISFLERNLVGTGKQFGTGVQVGKKHTNYYANLTEPNFLDRDLSLSGNFFRNQSGRKSGFVNGEQNYSIKSTGVSTSLGYDITEDLSHSVDYLIKQDVLRAPSSSSSRFIVEQMGTTVTSAIGHTLTYDRLDSRVLPKNGFSLSGTQEYAGLGGDNRYLKHEVEGKVYKSFVDNKYTVKLSANSGIIQGADGKKVRIFDRFNLGDSSLRGFEYGGVGPRDKVTHEGLGGQKYYSLSTELNFPLGLPEEFNVIGALFADAGALWDVDSKASTIQGIHNDKSLRASVGFGFLWITRIAPIRMDWGFPVKKEHYDEKKTFHLRFSTHF